MAKTKRAKTQDAAPAAPEEVSEDSEQFEDDPSATSESEAPAETPAPVARPPRTSLPKNDKTMTAVRAYRASRDPLVRAFLVVEAGQKVARRLTKAAWKIEFESFMTKERR